MVVVKSIGANRGPFIYGQLFIAPPKKSAFRPPSSDPRYAVEILREFSSTEFVGKLYVNVGTWIPAAWNHLSEHNWYQKHYSKVRGFPIATELLHFLMEGSTVWDVNFLRDESDESGPYIAIGMVLQN